MGYDEKEEIEATGEWLMRISDVGFAEELTYVPSYLSRVGVAPADVVDRLDWLRSQNSIKTSAVVGSQAQEAAAPVLVLERSEIVEAESSEVLTFVFDYDRFGPWEWAEPIEKMIEDSIKAAFDPEPGLHEFNKLASLMRSMPRRGRGKRARASAEQI